jgi:hypothetical protein
MQVVRRLLCSQISLPPDSLQVARRLSLFTDWTVMWFTFLTISQSTAMLTFFRLMRRGHIRKKTEKTKMPQFTEYKKNVDKEIWKES